MRLYVGGYGAGIALATVDGARAAAPTPDPSFLALAPVGDTLYAVNERAAGTVSAFAVAPDGRLRALGARSTGGGQPCHLAVLDRWVLAANYSADGDAGSVSVHPIAPDGSLGEAADVVAHTGSGPDPLRQRGPHVHQVRADPLGRFVHAVDLGADAVACYRCAGGRLERIGVTRLPAGCGPRHLAFHPGGRTAYLVGELAGTLTVCGYEPATGVLTPRASLPTAPPDEVDNFPSEVVVAPDGRFVYVANRGHDSIAVFAVAGADLAARGHVPCGGAWPRHIALAGDRLYVANERSDSVTVLRVDRRSGALAPAGPALATPRPAMVLPVVQK